MSILKSIARRFKSDSFTSDAAILMVGTTIAQAIVVLCSPILTRLYSPESFGVLATFISATSILGVIATGRYELAILVPKEHKDGFALVVLSCLISGVFSVLVLTGLLFAGLAPEYYLIPAAVFLSSAIGAFAYWRNREGDFWKIATSRLSASVSNAAVSIGIGTLLAGNAFGLITGILVGNVVGLALLMRRLPQLGRLPLRAVAERYARFPKYLILAHMISVVAQQLPLLLLGPMFGLSVAGFFMLTYRAISLPLQIVSGAIGEVFRRRAGEDLRESGQCRSIYLSTLSLLVVLSIPTFGLFFWLAPTLFGWVFGQEWAAGGDIARLLTPMFAMQFVASPLSAMFMIAEQQRLDLIWQVGVLGTVGLSFLVGFIFNDYLVAIGLYSAAYVVMQSINVVLTYRFASGWRL